jgi:hypothetical protein
MSRISNGIWRETPWPLPIFATESLTTKRKRNLSIVADMPQPAVQYGSTWDAQQRRWHDTSRRGAPTFWWTPVRRRNAPKRSRPTSSLVSLTPGARGEAACDDKIARARPRPAAAGARALARFNERNGRPRCSSEWYVYAADGPCVSPISVRGVGMDSDRICTNTNSDVTIYHILFRIRTRIRILSNTNTKRIFRIRIHIRIFTRFTT